MSRKPIIFVDDDPVQLYCANRTSKYLGCEIFFHDKIESALGRMQTVEPALLVLDMSMHNLDGFFDHHAGLEITRHVRERFGDAFPILVLTGHEDADLISECLRHGADDFFVKNQDFNALIKRIAAWLVFNYQPAEAQTKRNIALRALEKLVSKKRLLSVKEWRRVVLHDMWATENACATPALEEARVASG